MPLLIAFCSKITLDRNTKSIDMVMEIQTNNHNQPINAADIIMAVFSGWPNIWLIKISVLGSDMIETSLKAMFSIFCYTTVKLLPDTKHQTK